MFTSCRFFICTFVLIGTCSCSPRIPIAQDWAFIFDDENERLRIYSDCKFSKVSVYKDSEFYMELELGCYLKQFEICTALWKDGNYMLMFKSCSSNFAYSKFQIREEKQIRDYRKIGILTGILASVL